MTTLLLEEPFISDEIQQVRDTISDNEICIEDFEFGITVVQSMLRAGSSHESILKFIRAHFLQFI
jgi:hypothetical protein